MRRIVFGLCVFFGILVSLPVIAYLKIFKRENASHLFMKVFLRRFCRISLKMLNFGVIVHTTEDYENVEKTLIVANHQSVFDILIIMSLIETDMSFISKVENQKIPFLNLWMNQIGTIYFDRNDVRGTVKKLKEASQVLKETNRDVVIFPQGTRSRNTESFKQGSLKIADQAGADILPIGIRGTYGGFQGLVFKKKILDVFIFPKIEYNEYKESGLKVTQEEIQEMIFSKVKE